MKITGLTLHGLTVYSQPARVDFDALGEGLVAVVGPNGSGKTSLLEAPFAALWNSFPTRPGWYEQFSGPDAYIEASFDNDGHTITARIQVDANRRTTERHLLIDGEAATNVTKAAFDEAVAERFGTAGLALASVFACQSKRGNFLVATRGERKTLFVELLGLDGIAAVHERARDAFRGASDRLTVSRQNATQIEREAESYEDAEEYHAGASLSAQEARTGLAVAREAEQKAVAAAERIRAAAEQITSARAGLDGARKRLTAAETGAKEAAKLPAGAKQRRDSRLRFIEARKVDELEQQAKRRHDEALASINRRIAGIRAAIDKAPDFGEATKRLAELRKKDAAQIEANRVARAAMETLRIAEVEYRAAEQRREESLARAKADSAVLGDVPCRKPEVAPEVSAACPLLANARRAAGRLQQLETPTDDTAVRSAGQLALEHPVTPLKDYGPAIQSAEGMVARAEAVAGLHTQLAEVNAEREGADADYEQAVVQAREAVQAANAERSTIESDYEAELLEADAAGRRAATAVNEAREEVAQAQATIARLQEQAGEATRAAAAAQEARTAVVAAQKELDAANETLARAEARVEQALRIRKKALDAGLARSRMVDEVSDWSLLDSALGKDGVQALEISAAAPEVATLTNTLLEACYGPRFSVTLETLREKRDGGYQEVFDVRVFDGAECRQVEALSGGERVVVGEALSLALAIYNAKKSGVRWRTLWRDETAGALDPEHAQAYVQMLRRARQLGGFSQVIFIAHDERVWEAADAVAHVNAGRVEVMEAEAA